MASSISCVNFSTSDLCTTKTDNERQTEKENLEDMEIRRENERIVFRTMIVVVPTVSKYIYMNIQNEKTIYSR